MPIDAFQVNEHKHMLVKISSDFQPIKPECELKHMSMMEYTGKLLRTITVNQDLDLIQRAKDKMKGQMFIDFYDETYVNKVVLNLIYHFIKKHVW